MRATVAELEGAYALAVIARATRTRIVLARCGCPVVVGLGDGENFVASDVSALLPVTRRFIFLEEGDVAEIRSGQRPRSSTRTATPCSAASAARASSPPTPPRRAQYPHYMLKEIHEQPRAVAQTLEERVANGRLLEAAFGPAAHESSRSPRPCTSWPAAPASTRARSRGTSSSRSAGMPCHVEIASEYRYRNPVVPKNTLFVTISQSGETADTLAALRLAKQAGYLSSLAICNVPESSLVRESELVMLTRAGPEIGVASTKAFTTQIAALTMLVIALAKHRSADAERERGLVHAALEIPALIEKTLALDPVDREAGRALRRQAPRAVPRPRRPAPDRDGRRAEAQGNFLHPRRGLPGRRTQARAAGAGGRRHARDHRRAEQRPAGKAEVEPAWKCGRAAASCIVFADPESGFESSDGVTVIKMPRHVSYLQAPAVYTIPLQLLAYHVAILRGTDVDQPRNLAKSVTVE